MSQEPSDVLMDLRERMVRIETKLDFNADAAKAFQEIQEDHGQRISVLETRYKIGAALMAVMIFVVTFFQDWITSRFA